MKLHSESTTRNREPLLHVLEAVLPQEGLLLEIAAGTGEHAAFLAPRFPGLTWQPTDVDPASLASIDAWAADSGASNLLPARALDVSAAGWGIDRADAILAINLIHYVAWEIGAGLFAGAGRLLPAGGVLVTYGAYKVGGRHTAPSNEAFDRWLKSRDPLSGVRDVAEVEGEAGRHGLRLQSRVDMPANNFSLVFRKG